MYAERMFTLRLSFQGICLFTKAAAADSLKDGMVVLLPGATSQVGKDRHAADNSLLVPHQAILSFRLKNLRRARPVPDLEVETLLQRRRVELWVREACGASNCLRFIHGNQEGSFDFVPNLKEIAPSYGDIDPQDLTYTPGADIQAQVLIDKGRVYTNAEKNTWTFGPTVINPRTITQRLAHEVIVELTDVVKAKLVLTPLDRTVGSRIETLRLAPTHHGEPLVEVSITNRELPGQGKLRIAAGDPDYDFKWFFELVNDQEYRALRHLSHLCLPVPTPNKESRASLNIPVASLGRDCFGAQSS